MGRCCSYHAAVPVASTYIIITFIYLHEYIVPGRPGGSSVVNLEFYLLLCLSPGFEPQVGRTLDFICKNKNQKDSIGDGAWMQLTSRI